MTTLREAGGLPVRLDGALVARHDGVSLTLLARGDTLVVGPSDWRSLARLALSPRRRRAALALGRRFDAAEGALGLGLRTRIRLLPTRA